MSCPNTATSSPFTPRSGPRRSRARRHLAGRRLRAEAGTNARLTFLKRIVGLPGDRIALRHGRVIRNGRADTFTIEPCHGEQCDYPVAITVPANHYFMIDDNRGESDDSRLWGAVPKNAIIGRVKP